MHGLQTLFSCWGHYFLTHQMISMPAHNPDQDRIVMVAKSDTFMTDQAMKIMLDQGLVLLTDPGTNFMIHHAMRTTVPPGNGTLDLDTYLSSSR